MTLCFGLLFDSGLLPRFIRYYRSVGADRFLCVAHGTAARDRAEVALFGLPHLVVLGDRGPFTGLADSDTQDQLRAKQIPPGDWYAVADVDEFISDPDGRDLNALRSAAEAESADWVPGTFVDRVPAGGILPSCFRSDLTLDEQFPLASDLTAGLLEANTGKCVMARGSVPIVSGHHRGDGRRASFTVEVHHFKWCGKDFARRTQDRAELYGRLGLPWADEGRRFLEHYGRFGRVNLDDPRLHTRPARPIGA